jgi:hypothetical protein
MLCSLVLQRKRHSWWRSNQVLHTHYIGLSSQVLWACYKGIILVYDLLSGTYNVCTYYSTITYYPLQASLCWQVLYSFPQYRCTLKEERHIISVRWKLVIICLWKDLRWPLFSDFWCLVYHACVYHVLAWYMWWLDKEATPHTFLPGAKLPYQERSEIWIWQVDTFLQIYT